MIKFIAFPPWSYIERDKHLKINVYHALILAIYLI